MKKYFQSKAHQLTDQVYDTVAKAFKKHLDYGWYHQHKGYRIFWKYIEQNYDKT